MGQQQLLLVILVTIVVGIATVVAINIFGSSAEQANHDAVRQDLAQIGTSAQGWYIKPAMLGGGNNSFVGVTFRSVNFPGNITDGETALEAENLNGTYRIVPGNADSFTIEGRPSSNAADNDQVFVATVTRGAITMSPNLGDPAPAPTE
jgi:type II secretory pathway pseudopilin PulG